MLFLCPINSHSRLSTGRRRFLETSRTKGGGGSSHNSWKARIAASLYLPCCQALCQLSINNSHHDHNNWNKWPGITHRLVEPQLECAAVERRGEGVLALITEVPAGPIVWPTTGQRASRPLDANAQASVPYGIVPTCSL